MTIQTIVMPPMTTAPARATHSTVTRPLSSRPNGRSHDFNDFTILDVPFPFYRLNTHNEPTTLCILRATLFRFSALTYRPFSDQKCAASNLPVPPSLEHRPCC